MQTPVQIRYAGVILGTSDSVRPEEGAVFVAFPEPLPVGTRLDVVDAAGAHPARVDGVVEAAAQTVPGMRLRLLHAPGSALPTIVSAAPAPVQALDPAPSGDTAAPDEPANEGAVEASEDAAADLSGPTDTSSITTNGDGSKKKPRRRRR